MAQTVTRKSFLTGSAAGLVAAVAGPSATGAPEPEKGAREFYELRIYRVKGPEKQAQVLEYLDKALIPALGRQGVPRVGCFTVMDKPDDASVYALIPYPTLQVFAGVNPSLQADAQYGKAAADYFAAPKKDPVFTRIESKLCKAFAGMPVLELPAQTAAGQARMFELRTYESHTEERAARKVEMFNRGEMQVMRDTGLSPVFYGETLIGHDVPNLVYMLSAADMAAHKAHWKAFMGHPEWQRLKNLPEYRDTVSHISNIYLVPASFSTI